MAERKAKFSDSFSHVWSNGEPGVSAFELNIDLAAGGQDEVIAKLFKTALHALKNLLLKLRYSTGSTYAITLQVPPSHPNLHGVRVQPGVGYLLGRHGFTCVFSISVLFSIGEP